MILRLRFYNVIRILLQNFEIFSKFGTEMISKLGLKMSEIKNVGKLFQYSKMEQKCQKISVKAK